MRLVAQEQPALVIDEGTLIDGKGGAGNGTSNKAHLIVKYRDGPAR